MPQRRRVVGGMIAFTVFAAVVGGFAWFMYRQDRPPLIQTGPDADTVSPSPTSAAPPSRSIPRLDDTSDLIAIAQPVSAANAEFEIALMNATDGERVYLLPRVGLSERPVAWSPSGRQLLYRSFSEDAEGEIVVTLRVAWFAEGIDYALDIESYQEGADPVWINSETVAAVLGSAVLVMPADGRRATLHEAESTGVCAPSCPDATAIASDHKGQVAVTYNDGSLAVFRPGAQQPASVIEVEGQTECTHPFFHPEGRLIGMTCIVIPRDYDPASEDTAINRYAYSGWTVDIETSKPVKLFEETGGHEAGYDFFPWTADGRILVRPWSECAEQTQFRSVTGAMAGSQIDGRFGSFSPDRKMLAASIGNSCEGGLTVKIFSDRGELLRDLAEGHSPVWSPLS